MNKEELSEKIENFILSHGKVLVEWFKVRLEVMGNNHWKPIDWTDEEAMRLYNVSVMYRRKMTKFESNADKNILLTYLKYHNDDKQRVRYPWSFNYQEPERDLVLNPY